MSLGILIRESSHPSVENLTKLWKWPRDHGKRHTRANYFVQSVPFEWTSFQ